MPESVDPNLGPAPVTPARGPYRRASGTGRTKGMTSTRSPDLPAFDSDLESAGRQGGERGRSAVVVWARAGGVSYNDVLSSHAHYPIVPGQEIAGRGGFRVVLTN
jgi:hypothetical protein